jgi:multiple antibiotic resistance protein
MTTILSLFVPLFVLMDFIGTMPVFISLTRAMTVRVRRRTAVEASAVAGLIVFGFAVIGHSLLEYFSLSIEAVRVGGGLLLLYIAFGMILSSPYDPGKNPEGGSAGIVVSPLAIPLLAGPGSMTFAMIAWIDLPGWEKLYLVAALALAVVAGAALLLASSVINRLLGYEFTRGLEKITAVIVSFIALEMIMSGIKTYFFAGS